MKGRTEIILTPPVKSCVAWDRERFDCVCSISLMLRLRLRNAAGIGLACRSSFRTPDEVRRAHTDMQDLSDKRDADKEHSECTLSQSRNAVVLDLFHDGVPSFSSPDSQCTEHTRTSRHETLFSLSIVTCEARRFDFRNDVND
jgi:hypothetical protein